ncbi:DUF5110 domain-containing protein [Virgibacillus byunsanensis]|uniref:DUF5110 domain-containing protein n=2 Tax=Virgibacillus byunsanensis TaxID=570945 RepID=A0ABW3LQI6_9BACI
MNLGMSGVALTGYLYEDDGYSYNYQDNQFCFRTFIYKEKQLNTKREGLYTKYTSIQNVKTIG